MASNPQHEPTMEEILASIRKIISEDSTTEAPAAPVAAAPAPVAPPAPKAAEPPKPAPEPEVLELTQAIEEPAPLPPPVIEKPADEIVFQTIEEAPVSSQAQAPAHSGEGIFSDKTRKALDDAFADLQPAEEAPPPVRDRTAPIAPVEGLSVEAVFERAVRESFDPVLTEWLQANSDKIVERMKPVIREWLDEHFPAMLEEAVRSEVARAVKPRKR
jgi:cell pole-organizing protein PopZ